MITFIKTHFKLLLSFLLLGGIACAYIVLSGNEESPYEYVVAQRMPLVQQVSVTGRVAPAEEVDLAFERGGKVSGADTLVGDIVRSGDALVVLESGELVAQLQQAKAGLDAERARLAELKRGALPEEIAAAKTRVANATRSLDDASQNLQNVFDKALADREQVYADALSALQKAVNTAKSSLITLSDIQHAHTFSNTENGILLEAKARAVKTLLGADNAGGWIADFISPLRGGAFGLVQDAVNDPSPDNIDFALSRVLSALQDVRVALDRVPVTTDFTATEKTNIASEKSGISTEITSVSAKKQAISTQTAANASAIANAESSVTSAKNALATAKDDLQIKLAGAIAEQINAQEARVKSAEANIQNIEVQLGKTVLHAPIDGVVIRQDAKEGEIVSGNMVLVSLISDADFEIKAFVPEADIAKVGLGNEARVTLDAYGRDEVFTAQVVTIDPAETIIEGVATYQITLQFAENDLRIKPGMTANIDIVTATRENVIAIPQRAVIREDGKKYVRVLEGEDVTRVEVEIGLRGSGGHIEIISGLSAGDKVVTFIDE